MLAVAHQKQVKQLQQNKIHEETMQQASICMLSKWFTTIFAWSDFRTGSASDIGSQKCL